jgi:hypothetical protein
MIQLRIPKAKRRGFRGHHEREAGRCCFNLARNATAGLVPVER